jgi:hypothetical protein
MSILQVNTLETNTPAGVLAVRDSNNALTAIQPGAVCGTAANTAPVFQDSAGTQIGTLCRAWVQFDGTGTPAIAASFNVSSITDHAVGEYSINFTNNLPDGNYSSVFSCNDNTNASINTIVITTAPTTTSVRIAAVNSGSGALDLSIISASFFR